jgi:hypothetical protein
MAAAYVTVSLHSRPEFPKLCAFTGAANPRKWVTVRKVRSRIVIPIPFLGFIAPKDVVRFRLPASVTTAGIDKILGRIGLVAGVLLFLAYFILRIAAAGSSPAQRVPRPYQPEEGGISWVTLAFVILGTYIISKILRRINLRAVKIVGTELHSMELCFHREEYAKAFCTLNNLNCHSEPEKQRRASGRQAA